jgi:hypothetical protein
MRVFDEQEERRRRNSQRGHGDRHNLSRPR